MPRSNLDQALVTGLTLASNHAIASLDPGLDRGRRARAGGGRRRGPRPALGSDDARPGPRGRPSGASGCSDCSASDPREPMLRLGGAHRRLVRRRPPGPRRCIGGYQEARALAREPGRGSRSGSRSPSSAPRPPRSGGAGSPDSNDELPAEAAQAAVAQVVRDERGRDRRRDRVQRGDPRRRRRDRRRAQPGAARVAGVLASGRPGRGARRTRRRRRAPGAHKVLGEHRAEGGVVRDRVRPPAARPRGERQLREPRPVPDARPAGPAVRLERRSARMSSRR